INAVNNLEDILSVNDVDGFLVGPYDLSASLGIPGNFDHPSLIEALNHISFVSKRLKSLSGYHVIPTDFSFVEEKIEQGYQFIAHSLDILFLGNECQRSISLWNKTIKK
ncbi:2,4-dihydroxyhept-2-ene-1,7-dioic acid aldolase, partial [Candidatus Magnetomorum sp. HK-1]